MNAKDTVKLRRSMDRISEMAGIVRVHAITHDLTDAERIESHSTLYGYYTALMILSEEFGFDAQLLYTAFQKEEWTLVDNLVKSLNKQLR